MTEEIDKEIRAALAVIVRANVAPEARVFDFWVLGVEATEWLGYVRKESGTSHGYVITRRGASQVSDGAATEEFWRYSIAGMHSYFHSRDGLRSEDIFGAEIDKLLLNLRPELILTLSTGDEVRVGESQVSVDLFGFGPEKAHYALFDIEVKFAIC